jgi:MipA family protein
MHHTCARLASLLFSGAVSVLVSANVAARDGDAAHDPWRVMIGGGIVARPEFPGSDSTELLPLPMFDVTYDDRWFFNRDGLGAYIVNDARRQLSVSVTADLAQRDESDADHLRGTGDVDRTAVALLKGGYRIGPIQAVVGIATDVADEGHGTVVDVLLSTRSQLMPRLALDYGIAGRWIDGEHARTFFGVDAGRGARSGLPVYAAESGVGEARAFVTALYTITPRWIVSAGGAIAGLQGDAADSPIVEDDSYFTANAAVFYRF